MYNGIINVDTLDANETLELLEACDELNFNELMDDLQKYLIIEKKKWIQQNLMYVHKTSLKHQLFGLLRDHCNKLICEDPEVLLKSNDDDVTIIEKSILVSILNKDDLDLDEIYVWDY